MRLNATGALLASLVPLLLAGPARATSIPAPSADQMVLNASLVFHGEVVDVAHRNADVVEPGDVALPHTFVTFRVERVLKGAADETVTLRFQGGPDGRGRVLEVSGVPQFRVGQRALLFVRDTSAAICPLVGWEHGHVRLERGRARISLGLDVTDEAGYLAAVADRVRRLHSPAELAALPVARSASILDPLRVPAVVAAPAPASMPRPQPSDPGLDLWEEALLREGGGDPTLPIR